MSTKTIPLQGLELLPAFPCRQQQLCEQRFTPRDTRNIEYATGRLGDLYDTGWLADWHEIERSAELVRACDAIASVPIGVFVSFMRSVGEDLSTYGVLETIESGPRGGIVDHDIVEPDAVDYKWSKKKKREFEVIEYNWSEDNYAALKAAQSYCDQLDADS